MQCVFCRVRGVWAIFLLVSAAFSALGQSNQVIYADTLQNGWQNWGWATLNYTNTAVVHSGSKAISVKINDSSWQAIYIEHPAFDTTPYGSLSFWINGGPTGGQQVQVLALLNGTPQTSIPLPPLPTNSWKQYTLSLAALGVANQPNMDGIYIQDSIGAPQPIFYLDDLSLVGGSIPAVTLTSPLNLAAFTAPANISLTATVATNGHAINKVQFFNGASLVGEDTTPPYSLTASNLALGSYTFSATATYDSVDTVSSSIATVQVVTNLPVNITINAQSNRHAINPMIYGTAFAGSAGELAELNCPVHRSGGNSETRYNWQANAHNHGADWYYETICEDSATPGGAADDFVQMSKDAGVDAMLTIPMIGWAPKINAANRSQKLASYSIAKYGAQTGNDSQWFADAGNGISTSNSTPITWNDPNDANFATNSAFQRAWIQHLTNRWGTASNGGVRYYFLDNEHSIWHSSHQDIHPIGAKMTEIRDKCFEYAAMIKAVDTNAIVLGPEEWGWSGYFYSGYDQQYGSQHGWSFFPDRATNGGWDYLPWLLNQFRLQETNTHQRLLDYFTLHCYPQGGEFSDDISASMQSLRNRSTRSLWDTNYFDTSWIQSVVQLIPRMKSWVTNYYPGTKIGITEYNWGAEGSLNGATAQGDIFGIFGRENIDLATRWTTPASNSPAYNAMKLYRNYDGHKSTFGDQSIYAGGPNPDSVAVFSSLRSTDGAMTIVLINKQSGAGASATIFVTNFPTTGTAQVWQMAPAYGITRQNDLTFAGKTVTATVPPQSLTMLVLPGAKPGLRPGGVGAPGNARLWIDGQAGEKYVIESTTNLSGWTILQTNTLVTNSLSLTLPATGSKRWFRARWTL